MKARKPAEDRKADILQTALRLAFDVGPDRVTTGQIADRLGLTQPAIYKHFSSKEDIWRAVADHLAVRVENLIRRTASLPPEPRLRALVLGHLRLVREAPALPEIMVMRDIAGRQKAFRQQMQNSMAAFRAALTGAIDGMRNTGAMRADIDAQDAAVLLLGVVQSLVLRLLVTRDTQPLLADGERLLDLQISVLAQNGEPA